MTQKLLLISIFSLILNAIPISSQVRDLVYLTSTFSVTDSVTQFLKYEVTEKKSHKMMVKTYYYNNDWKQIDRKIYRQECDSVYLDRSAGEAGNLEGESLYLPNRIVIKEIEKDLYSFKEYNYVDTLIRKGTCKSYFPLIKHGEVVDYYINGNTANKATYDNNVFISAQRWMMDGHKSMNNVYTELADGPKFKNKSIKEFYTSLFVVLKYDANDGRKDRLEGTCTIEFIIDKEGEMHDIQFIQKSTYSKIDNQIANFLVRQKGKWSPAKLNNEAVNYVCRIGVSFGT